MCPSVENLNDETHRIKHFDYGQIIASLTLLRKIDSYFIYLS